MEHVIETHCRLFLDVKRYNFTVSEHTTAAVHEERSIPTTPSLTELTAVGYLSCLRTQHKINNHNSATSSTYRRGLYENEFILIGISNGFRNLMNTL